jgi:hypothetical protein
MENLNSIHLIKKPFAMKRKILLPSFAIIVTAAVSQAQHVTKPPAPPNPPLIEQELTTPIAPSVTKTKNHKTIPLPPTPPEPIQPTLPPRPRSEAKKVEI